MTAIAKTMKRTIKPNLVSSDIVMLQPELPSPRSGFAGRGYETPGTAPAAVMAITPPELQMRASAHFQMIRRSSLARHAGRRRTAGYRGCQRMQPSTRSGRPAASTGCATGKQNQQDGRTRVRLSDNGGVPLA